jgi:hypothetical protein
VAAALTLAFGCAAPPPHDPVFLHSKYFQLQPDVITLLPVVDVKPKRFLDPDADQWVQNAIERALVRKGYQVFPIHSPEDVAFSVQLAAFDAKAFSNPTPEFVETAGPLEARWVMIVVLRDLSGVLLRELLGTLADPARSQIDAYLLDRERGEMLWWDSSFGRSDKLFDLPATPGKQALRDAVLGLIRSFPPADSSQRR